MRNTRFSRHPLRRAALETANGTSRPGNLWYPASNFGQRSPAPMRKQLLAFGAVLVMAIAASAEEDWRLHGGSQTDQRFSPLNQIDEETVSRLGLLWSQEL